MIASCRLELLEHSRLRIDQGDRHRTVIVRRPSPLYIVGFTDRVGMNYGCPASGAGRQWSASGGV
jgi:hypothetical protein